jgi:ribonuclease P protein component
MPLVVIGQRDTVVSAAPRLEFLGEQADLPAQQPPPGQDPRLPAADAHPRRPGDPVRAPRQGPQPTLGLKGDPPVLPRQARLRRRAEFSETIRRGRRAGSPAVVVHLLDGPAGQPATAGFIVSRAVGGAVVRNSVRRRLRHLVGDRLDRLPTGARLVVRATPASAQASSRTLAAELDRSLDRLMRPVATS